MTVFGGGEVPKRDPMTTALVALFEALAERDGVPVSEIVEAFIAEYERA